MWFCYDRSLSPQTYKLYFNFIKAVGIVGIFLYHAYESYIGGQKEILKILNAGVSSYFFTNVTTIYEYLCATTQVFLIFGSIGAELFIFASGFGLYYSYLSRRKNWGTFYSKRFWRIIPLYYCALIAGFLFNVYFVGNPFYSSAEGFKVLVYHFLFLQTFTISYRYYSFLYFIAIIFHLYLLFPVLVRLMKSKSAGFLIFISSFFFTAIINLSLDFLGINFQGVLFTDFLPYFLFGMLIADSLFHNKKYHTLIFDKRLSLLSFAFLLVLLYANKIDYSHTLRILIIFLGLFSLYNFFSLALMLRQKAVIDFVAYASYATYLFHIYLIGIGLTLFSRIGFLSYYLSWIPVVSIIFAVTLFASYFLQKYYDRFLLQVGYN